MLKRVCFLAPLLIFSPTRGDIGYTAKSSACVYYLTEATLILCLQANAPWKRLKDLMDDAKKKPGERSFPGPEECEAILQKQKDCFGEAIKK